MISSKRQVFHWLAALAVAVGVTACGGGGGGGGGSTPVTPHTPDARNGDYQMYAADARLYTLSLDFDAKTYHVAGNGQDLRGSVTEINPGFFQIDSTSTSLPPDTPRFMVRGNTAIGNFRFPAGLVPFIAPRSFMTTLADAAGTYNFLTTSQDTANPPNNAIFTGELLASGTLRTCNDNTIYKISLCPAASLITSTVTVNGDQFVADTGTGTFPFRVARINNERVFLRASPSSGTARRFWVGTIEAPFADGARVGANNFSVETSTTITGTSYSANWVSGGHLTTKTGTVTTLGSIGPSGIVAISTTTDEHFFAIGNSTVTVVVGARDNTFSTWYNGYVELDRQ